MIDNIIVTGIGILSVFFVYWFFLMRKDKVATLSSGAIDIVVDGGYKPDVILTEKGKTLTLNFIRKDSNTCLEEVIFGDFRIRKFLPLNERVEIKITPPKEGKYLFSCGMDMFHGKVVVR